jgi:hypothetical protein
MVPINNDYLTLTVHRPGGFDESTNRFIPAGPDVTVVLEHSITSMQRWESKWHKPYGSREDKTTEEVAYYMQCMVHYISDPEAFDSFYNWFTPEQVKSIEQFILDTKSGHKIRSKEKNNEIVAVDYYYCVLMKLRIPVEYVQHWHINRLFALIDMFNIMSEDPDKKKRSKADIIKDYDRLNEERLKKWNTKG